MACYPSSSPSHYSSPSHPCSPSSKGPCSDSIFSSDSSSCTEVKCSKIKIRNSYERKCYDPGVYCFLSMIVPLNNLAPGYSGSVNMVQFTMRRKNKVVTLQWEPFSGDLAATGISYLTATQGISNLPPFPLDFPIFMKYTGTGRIVHLRIVPTGNQGNIFFYLNTDGSSDNTNMGDHVEFSGGCVSWVISC